MPHSHKVSAGVCAGTDQNPYRLHFGFGHRDRGNLAQPQQPRQMRCVARVSFDPPPAGRIKPEGAGQVWQPNDAVPMPARRLAWPTHVDLLGIVAEVTSVLPGHKDILPVRTRWLSQLRCHLSVQQT